MATGPFTLRQIVLVSVVFVVGFASVLLLWFRPSSSQGPTSFAAPQSDEHSLPTESYSIVNLMDAVRPELSAILGDRFVKAKGGLFRFDDAEGELHGWQIEWKQGESSREEILKDMEHVLQTVLAAAERHLRIGPNVWGNYPIIQCFV